MDMNSLHRRALALVVGIIALAFSGLASADPPSRAARLGYVSGAVSFSPAGENDWVQATLNRPLTTGDRLWADPGARAEIQIGGAMVRMNSATSVSVLNLDDQITQLQLTQGAMNVRVLRLERDQTFEVDTPNVAFTLRQPGEYRIEVDPEGRATTVIVRKGQGEVYGEDAAFVIDSRQPYRFFGTGLREYQRTSMPQFDEFDRWSSDRDRRHDTSISARYVSPDVVGYQDLDAHGSWRVDATYGNVWFPNRVAVGWAPYSDGHWAWIDPWGWTWVDDAPWGYAVSHYGRWANLQGTWGWVPGPVRTRAYYAPALVVFIGGANFQLSISSGNVGGVGWFPLGPREVYQPAYPVSRRYYEDINRSNTVINNTVINNTYNNINVTNVVYANQRVPGAVVAVPATAFVQSQPVSRAAVRVTQEVIVNAPVTVVPTAVPTEISVRGNALQRDRPPARALERPVVARTVPPPAPVGFAAQQPQLSSKPGKPLDEAAHRELKPAAAVPTVKVIEAKVAAPTTLLPPARVPADSPGKSDSRKSSGATPAAEPKVSPPAPVARPPEQRERSDQGKGNQQRAPSLPSAAPALPAPTQAAPPPKAAPTAPVARPPEQRERDQPGKGSQQRAPSPPVAAPVPQVDIPPGPKAAMPAPVAQPPQQLERADQPGKGSQQRAPAPPVAAPPPPPSAPVVNVPPGPKAAPPVAQPPDQRERSDQGKGNQQRAPSPPVAAPAPPPAAPPVKAAPLPTATPQAPAARPPEQRDRAEQPGKGGARTPPVATSPPPPGAPQAAVPPVPKAVPPAGQDAAGRSAGSKKDKEKGKEETKP